MDYITTKEAAELQGCTVQYLRKLCKTGAVECKVSKSVKGKDMYLIPVSALSEQAQHKYGKQLRESMQLLPETAESKPPAKRKSPPPGSATDSATTGRSAPPSPKRS